MPECCICYKNKQLREIDCSHSFCHQCIQKWYKENKRKGCPLNNESSKEKQKTHLILEQNPKNIKGTQALPYEFGRDIYEVYSNPKNPFLGRILGGEVSSLDLDPKKAGALVKEIITEQRYRVHFPGSGSAHQKRKIARGTTLRSHCKGYKKNPVLPENQIRLQTAIEAFFYHSLNLLKEDPNRLAQLVNDLLPLFVKHEVRIRIYPSYRQFSGFEQFLDTLEKITEDFEIENLEIFFSALFGFYSQQG